MTALGGRGGVGWLAVVALLVVTACSSTQLPELDQTAPTQPATTLARPSTTTTPDSPADPSDQTRPAELLEIPGRLAALGPAGELLVRAGNTDWEQWSADARLVTQFGWSPDGARMTWTEAGDDGTELVVGDGRDRALVPLERPPFFVWWTPDGSRVSHLGAAGDQITLALSPIDGQADQVLAEASPLFYSLSPSGRVAVHEAGTDLGVVEGATVDLVARTSGGFQAPAWLDDERLLAVVQLERGDAFAIVDTTDGSVTPLFDVDGSISFAVSPDGRRVAYQILQGAQADDRPVGNRVTAQTTEPDPPDVLVLDLETQQATLAFIGQARWLDWSPDSRALAGLIDAGDLTWRVWDEQELTRSAPVEISPVMAESFVPFYDQYTQALTGWSPDSSLYAFAASMSGRTGVFVQPAEVGAEASFLGPGVMVAWAPQAG